MYIYINMNIIKYLQKANIDCLYDSKTKSFTFDVDNKTVVYSKKEIEQYLFIRLVELIKD